MHSRKEFLKMLSLLTKKYGSILWEEVEVKYLQNVETAIVVPYRERLGIKITFQDGKVETHLMYPTLEYTEGDTISPTSLLVKRTYIKGMQKETLISIIH